MNRSIFAASIITSTAASALAQGTVFLENAASNGNITKGYIYLGQQFNEGYAQAGSYTVALLWAPGGSLNTPQSNFIQIALYGLATGGATQTGFFSDPNPITVPGQASGTVGVFEVQGWSGAFTSYLSAEGFGTYVGQTPEFLNNTGNSTPVNITGWDGNLILESTAAPEPGTLAIAALGTTVLILFRRRKHKPN
jgi:hypothetical protein